MKQDSPWTPHFSLDELKCHCGQCGSTGLEMQDSFMQHIIWLRLKMAIPFKVSSGYRCKTYNTKISSSGEFGPHTFGKALDILFLPHQFDALLELVYTSKRFTGKGGKKAGNYYMIHLDTLTKEDHPRFKVRPNFFFYD